MVYTIKTEDNKSTTFIVRQSKKEIIIKNNIYRFSLIKEKDVISHFFTLDLTFTKDTSKTIKTIYGKDFKLDSAYTGTYEYEIDSNYSLTKIVCTDEPTGTSVTVSPSSGTISTDKIIQVTVNYTGSSGGSSTKTSIGLSLEVLGNNQYRIKATQSLPKELVIVAYENSNQNYADTLTISANSTYSNTVTAQLDKPQISCYSQSWYQYTSGQTVYQVGWGFTPGNVY